jgi:hypothetical protein
MRADRTPDLLGVVRFAEFIAVPWRNGGGVTREVMASGGSGPQGFDWRISIADVNAPGPCSALPDIDRTITIVEGEGMDLVIDGVEHVLGLHELLSFEGESDLAQSVGRTGPRPQRHDAQPPAVGHGRHQGPLGSWADRRRWQPGPGAPDRIGRRCRSGREPGRDAPAGCRVHQWGARAAGLGIRPGGARADRELPHDSSG